MSHLSAELSADKKRELLARLLKERARQSVSECPLSHGQRALWFVHQLDPDSPAYIIHCASRVRPDVDRSALQRALQQIVDRHATLRTTYSATGGVPTARIASQHEMPLQIIDAAGLSEAELNQHIFAEADRPFDLENGPVLRTQLFDRGSEAPVLLITAAHIAIDFWSLDMIMGELTALYRELMTGSPANLWPAKVQYRDFIAWQEEMLAGPEGERLWKYWSQQLAGPLPALDLPTDRPRPAVQTYRGASHRFDLPDELAHRLAALGKAEGATLYMMLLAAFEVLLYRYSGQRDLIVGSTTAGRNRAEWEDTVGYFLNVTPLRGQLAPEMTFLDFLGQVKRTVLGGLDHQDLPFAVLVERLSPPRDVSRSPIFQVAFNWDRPRKSLDEGEAPGQAAAGQDPGDLDLVPFAFAQQGSAFDLTLVMMHRGDSLAGAWQYNTDLFDAATIARFSGHLVTLLEAVAANPRQQLADLPLLARSERQMLVEDWNDTAADYPRDACLHDLFTTQAARTPEKTAVSHGDRALTYRELDERSNRLGRHLQKLGVGPDSLVGIFVERSPEMLVGLLGILKAGGAYVPLAPGTPAERLAYMLQESRAPVVLTERALASALPPTGSLIVQLDDDWPAISAESSAPVPRTSSPANLAYVIFTSGSTGKPKGVEIEHRSVVNFLTSMRRRPGIGPDDRLLAVTTLSFDISALELFLPLTVGGEVVVVSREVASDGMQLLALLRESRGTIMQATPATWRLLIQAGWQGDPKLKVLCGGEALPRDLADALVERSGSLWNMYGPTETTIWSSVDRVLPAGGPVLIGPPIANTQFYILDERLEAAPLGVPGELWIGGDGLARGYLNRPELTADRFRADPFRLGAGQRMYRTGDLARFRPDGRIEFLGRLDNQVKVRGFRIELGEIEAVLAHHPAIRESVVTARQMSSHADDKQLVAYLVAANGHLPATSDLREFLKQKLPDYMVPAHYVPLPALPLNPSGKVDRKALPAPQGVRMDVRTEYAAPRTSLEETLAEIWASILDVERVGIHDDFFDLGGASMPSLEIAARAEAEGVHFTPAFLFQHPTIAQLAGALTARGSASAQALPESDGAVTAEMVVEEPQQLATQTADLPQPKSVAQTARGNTVIESLGVYLPPNEVTTEEVVRGCQNRVWFPLERMAGIHSRRMSGEGDYCVDLARKAIERCFAISKYGPADIDLIICCNITRAITPVTVLIEPNTAMSVKKLFGMDRAIAFDVTNACGGMFTAIWMADAFLQLGLMRRALVVSGEYITGITKSAQIEINGFLDSRIACLTVGDAGAAVLIEAADNRSVGFHELELYSVSRYNRMCIGKLTDQPHGGPIMHVPDPIKHTSISAEQSVMHAQHMFEKAPWPPEKTDHLIIHQTSRRTLRDGMRAINKAFGKKVSHEGNTLDNISNRGNTATTTHFVAMWDQIESGKIKSGEKVLFAISGSGQTIGTGLYTLDDLPDRVREYQTSGKLAPKTEHVEYRPAEPAGPRVAITSVGTASVSGGAAAETTQLSVAAAEECLKRWGKDRNEIDLLIFAGLTRSEYVTEPAIATFIAGDLKINDCPESGKDRKTLAFDIYNAALAPLNACEVAARAIQAGKCRAAMIVASEIEINAQHHPDRLLGMCEAGSAIILEAADQPERGFGPFVYHFDLAHSDARTITGIKRHDRPFFDLRQSADVHDRFADAAAAAVQKLLAREGLTMDDFQVVLPPQISPELSAKLAERLGVPLERLVDSCREGQDLFTNSLGFSLQQALANGRAKAGDLALVIGVASGIQACCTTYRF
jgi:amino acid adenylation domain-containing protein